MTSGAHDFAVVPQALELRSWRHHSRYIELHTVGPMESTAALELAVVELSLALSSS